MAEGSGTSYIRTSDFDYGRLLRRGKAWTVSASGSNCSHVRARLNSSIAGTMAKTGEATTDGLGGCLIGGF